MGSNQSRSKWNEALSPINAFATRLHLVREGPFVHARQTFTPAERVDSAFSVQLGQSNAS